MGDLAAGTLVVHQVPTEDPLGAGTGARLLTLNVFEPLPTPAASIAGAGLPLDQLAKLSMDDVRAMETFFVRRIDLPVDTRSAMALTLAARITERTGLAPLKGASIEAFLESAVAGRRSIGGRG